MKSSAINDLTVNSNICCSKCLLQDIKNSEPCSADSTCELTKFPVKENSVDKGSELGETIAACKEAFGSLDAAAESVLQLFLKLENVHGIYKKKKSAIYGSQVATYISP